MTEPTFPPTKRELRLWGRRLTPPTAMENHAVVGGLGGWMAVNRPESVLVYLAMPGELDLASLVTGFPQVRWLTTRTPAAGWLTIHDHSAPRELHRLGYQNPVETAPTVDPSEVSAALVPGLCFDPTGTRIGWGRGFYDELLSRTGGIRLGVTLERRIAASIPVESHDIRMDLLATETGVRSTHPSV